MWQRLLLTLLLLAPVKGASQSFLFPEERTPAATDASSHGDDDASTFEGREHDVESVRTDDYQYTDYDPNSVDVGGDDDSEGLETRFFFGKRTSASIGRKLSEAASSLLNTIHGGSDLPPPPTAPPIVRTPLYPTGGDPYQVGSPYPPNRYPPHPYGADDRPSDTVGYGEPSYGRYRQGLPSAHATVTDHRGDASGYGQDEAGISTDYDGTGHGGGDQNSATDYSASDDALETRMRLDFPVDRIGRIVCGRVPRWKKKACRKARRKQNRSRGRTPKWPPSRPPIGRPSVGHVSTAAPITCPTVPDEEAMSNAEELCCSVQQRGDLHGFNKCCQTLGFCPICKVDSEKLAQEECCEILHGGDTAGYRQCCSRYGTCPDCGPPPTPPPEPEPPGCTYKKKRFPVGTRMDRIPSKCMFVRCADNGEGPEMFLDYIDDVGCCVKEGDGKLYPPGGEQPKDECTKMVCENGAWVPKPTNLASVFDSPCPARWLDLGGSCVYIWDQLMTFTNATEACAKLSATLALPQNNAQLTQLINAFKNMEHRDPKVELGGWMNARFQRRQWQTLQGDTLTFAPWEENYPDDLLRTSCAGLTVTDSSQGWKDYMCDHRSNMMFPVCQVEKPKCGERRSGCGPYNGDELFHPGSQLTMLSSQCERFVCNEDSYVVREVNKHCCYHKEWNAKDFGKKRGWYTGLFPPGSFHLYEGLRCECKNGISECNRFFN